MRLRNAGESSFLPKSPEGFIVATILNAGWAYILTASWLDFSVTTRVRPSSKTELRRSSTESLAREISSISKSPPCCIDSTSMPSCHSKTQFKSSSSRLISYDALMWSEFDEGFNAAMIVLARLFNEWPSKLSCYSIPRTFFNVKVSACSSSWVF